MKFQCFSSVRKNSRYFIVNCLCTFVHPVTADPLKDSLEESETVSGSGKAVHSNFFILMPLFK